MESENLRRILKDAVLEILKVNPEIISTVQTNGTLSDEHCKKIVEALQMKLTDEYSRLNDKISGLQIQIQILEAKYDDKEKTSESRINLAMESLDKLTNDIMSLTSQTEHVETMTGKELSELSEKIQKTTKGLTFLANQFKTMSAGNDDISYKIRRLWSGSFSNMPLQQKLRDIEVRANIQERAIKNQSDRLEVAISLLNSIMLKQNENIITKTRKLLKKLYDKIPLPEGIKKQLLEVIAKHLFIRIMLWLTSVLVTAKIAPDVIRVLDEIIKFIQR